ncbi:UBC-like protein [Cantharellus anzutake]|uniref:UBC-like protein n=1 Tax=Cantharellus anzutake TaxID=1750568 RepID=UPI0019074B47|nr:UBC-like protein [Cantharellus anzutake]KAF8320611.1 UBC-like protein [Cantharellus anzutake]
MASISNKRLAKELASIHEHGCPEGIKLLQADDLKTWFLSLEILGESLYKGEVFALRFTFGPRYPIESPEVVFVVNDTYQAPIHPHIYSNGHICASILGNEWSPVLNTSSICLTLQSMLASCKKKERPEGNDRYVKTAPLSPKNTHFLYEDDTV